MFEFIHMFEFDNDSRLNQSVLSFIHRPHKTEEFVIHDLYKELSIVGKMQISCLSIFVYVKVLIIQSINGANVM